MEQLGLSGEWEFRFDEEHNWRRLAVPGCWELLDLPKDHPGPAWYRTRFVVPDSFAGHRLWLRFDAVSYACTVWVNGREVGSHLGLWDAFRFEVTDALDAGGQAEVHLRVEKPAMSASFTVGCARGGPTAARFCSTTGRCIRAWRCPGAGMPTPCTVTRAASGCARISSACGRWATTASSSASGFHHSITSSSPTSWVCCCGSSCRCDCPGRPAFGGARRRAARCLH